MKVIYNKNQKAELALVENGRSGNKPVMAVSKIIKPSTPHL
jgi:hypothetical protein